MEEVDYLDLGSLVLVIVGALNWGLVGLEEFAGGNLNAVELLTGLLPGGMATQVEAVVYLLVGLAGLYQIYFGYELYQE